jgi:LTXXQ motif family protein
MDSNSDTGGIMQKKKLMHGVVLMLMLGVASALGAQGRGMSAADTGRAARMQRMEAHIKKELGLTDDQAAKLHASMEKFEPQRHKIMERGRALHEALRGQLQPGVAANADSVSKLLEARQQNRAALLQLGRDADRELSGYLTPVQRARLEMMREHMMMHEHGMMGHGDMHGPGPGMHGGHMQHEGDGEMRPYHERWTPRHMYRPGFTEG